MPLISVLSKWRQKDKEFKASLLCIEIGTSLEHDPHCLKKLNKKLYTSYSSSDSGYVRVTPSTVRQKEKPWGTADVPFLLNCPLPPGTSTGSMVRRWACESLAPLKPRPYRI